MDDFFELLYVILGQHKAFVVSSKGIVRAEIKPDIPFIGKLRHLGQRPEIIALDHTT